MLAAAVLAAVLVPAFGVQSDERAAPQLEPTASLPVPETPPAPVPEAPAVEVPDIPGVQTPDSPAAPVPDTPAVATPDVPPASAPDAPSAATPSAAASASRSTAAPGAAATGGGPDADAGSAGAPAEKRAAAAGSQSPAERRAGARRRRAARERRLRARVEKLQGCLGSLPEGERRVLELRAGLGDLPARSVRQVADELDVPASDVRASERRGLRRLARADRETGCGGRSAGGAQTIGSGGGESPLLAHLPRLRAVVALAGPDRLVPVARLGDRDAVPRARASSEDSRDAGDVAGATAEGGSGPSSGGGKLGSAAGNGARTTATAGADGIPIWPLLLAGALALLIVSLVTMRTQRSTAPGRDVSPSRPATTDPDTPAALLARAAQLTTSPTPSDEAPPGDTAMTAASSPDTAVTPDSPGDTAAAPGPPAASAAAGAAAGATRDENRKATVVRRRTGGLLEAARPARERAARVARDATTRLRDIARRARERRR